MALYGYRNNEVRIEINAHGQQAVQAITEVSASLSGLANAAAAPRDALVGVTSASRGLGDSVRSLIGFLGGLQLSLAAIREGRHLVELASDFQKLEYAWGMFIGTGKKAQEELKWVEELGGRTFGIRNLTRAMIDLQATGIQPTRREMEGFLGYMMAAGKTHPQQLASVIDRITALFQLGNIGMEDALKELTQYVPFLMAALREKLNLSVSDMYQEFTRRGVDFATIIRAIFEYAGRNFSKGLTDTENFWDVLTNRMRAKKELFEKELMQSGSFQGLNSMVSDWVSQLDVLEQDGTLRRWAVEIGDNLEKVGEALGLRNLDMRTVGETVVKLSDQFETLAGAAKGVANALEGVGKAGIDVELPDQGLSPEERDDNLRTDLGAAGEVVALLGHVRDDEDLQQVGGLTAYSLAEADPFVVRRFPREGAKDQLPLPLGVHKVETDPVVAFNPLLQEPADSLQKSLSLTLRGDQLLNLPEEFRKEPLLRHCSPPSLERPFSLSSSQEPKALLRWGITIDPPTTKATEKASSTSWSVTFSS
ncbi:MAG: hypothetical protein BWY86_00687 [Candidatus Aminicenantes bacterium ADurb.Bin508]|nr:MAG: hypothetical protein BWY86_00687 [Candidatus Aminicenantes bacterium ADurb.Bin508]